MLANRSMPRCTVIPELVYKDVFAAGKWLCDAFGFIMRIDMGSHRAQLNVGDGAVVLMEPPEDYKGDRAHAVVWVEDVYSHCEHAQQRGTRVMRPPADYPYGER